MPINNSRNAGRHQLQIPGPTPTPERLLSAMSPPMLDPLGPPFKQSALHNPAGADTPFKTSNPARLFTPVLTTAW